MSEATNFSSRRRTIHNITKYKDYGTKSSRATDKKITHKRKAANTNAPPQHNYTLQRPASEAGLWKSRTTKWEDFDLLARYNIDEDVVSTSSTLTNDLYYGSARLDRDEHNLKSLKSAKTSNFNYKTNSTKAKKKKKPYNYRNYEYLDANNVHVAVVHEELDSANDLSNYVANRLPENRETKLSPSKRYCTELGDGTGKSQFYTINSAHDNNDVYMVRMDTSFNQDLKKGASNVQSKILKTPVKRISQEDDENSMELSPIQRTEQSLDDRSLENNSPIGRPHRGSVVTMLYKLPEIKKRITKYSKSEFNNSYSSQSDPVRLMKNDSDIRNGNFYEKIKCRVKPKSEFEIPKNGFRDLMQYENFKDDLPEVPESYNEEDSGSDINSRYTGKSSVLTKTRKFFIPDDSRNVIDNERDTAFTPIDRNTEILQSRLSNNASTLSGVKSLVRRYGKKKHEREMGLR